MDRLSEFGKAKQEAIAEGVAFERADQLEKGDAGTGSGATAAPVIGYEEETLQMPEFYKQCEEVTNNAKVVEKLTDELEKLHKSALNAATADESGDTSAKIDVITAKTNSLSNKSRTILKNMEIENEQFREIAPPGSGHMRMRESKHRQLAATFLKVTKKLQKLQQFYRDKYKQQLERQYKIVNPAATAEEIAKVTSDPEGAKAKIFASAVKDDAKKTLNQMKDRFQDVKVIERSIIELHQLFLDLQTMVVEQGDMINRVEFNVDKTCDYTEEAAADMKMAVEYQKSIWKKKWFLVVIAIILILIVIVILLRFLTPVFQTIALFRSPQPAPSPAT